MNRRVGRRSAEMAGEYGARLSRRISAALLATLAALWLTGAIWLLLHYLWAQPDEFGIARHPLEAPTMLVHGVIAMLALFLLGWFAGRHAGAASSGRRVASGVLLTVLMAMLVAAGCAQLFLTGAAWQSAAALTHESLGVALLLLVLAHARRARAAYRARAAGAGDQAGASGPLRQHERRGPDRRRSAHN